MDFADMEDEEVYCAEGQFKGHNGMIADGDLLFRM
jgi:hypothetical protein